MDTALAAYGQFVSVRTLDDAHAGRQEREVEKIATVVGQVLYRFLRQSGGRLRPGDVYGGPSCHNDELFHFYNHLDRQFNGLSNPDLHARLTGFGPPLCAYRHVVEPEWQQGGGEQAGFRRRQDSPVIGTGLYEDDRGAFYGIVELIAYETPDYTRCGLRLGARREVRQADRQHEERQGS